jgi:hypothetical protein
MSTLGFAMRKPCPSALRPKADICSAQAHVRVVPKGMTAKVAYKRALERQHGSQGAASPVRKIDPVTGEVIANCPSEQRPAGTNEGALNTRQHF